ncbi:MAG: EVE domain-containing protein [Bdellovibrionales bacterium]|nr:EVE domain-containing protein [Bdellovibrionales bacterium]
MSSSTQNFWLMKSEPSVFSIADLSRKKKTLWDGVRNYQARNFMINDMLVGDEIFFYHSSCEVPGIAGLCRVSQKAQPDPSQFDRKSDYFDSKATKDHPIWFAVEVEFLKKYEPLLPLSELRKYHDLLQGLPLLQKGQRLSIQPVKQEHFLFIKKLVTNMIS